MDTKKKKIAPGSRRRFVAVWTWATIAGWLGAVGIGLFGGAIHILPALQENMFLLAILTGVLPAVMVGWLQKRVIERYLHRDMSGWTGMSLAGGAIAGVLMYVYILAVSVLPINPMLSFLPLLMPPAVMQWFWLRQHVKSSWMWLASAMVTVLLFTLPAQMETGISGTDGPFALLTLLLYPIISGLTMYHLWTQDDDKRKVEVDEAMLKRLSEHDAEDADDIPDDEQEAQRGGYRIGLWQFLRGLFVERAGVRTLAKNA